MVTVTAAGTHFYAGALWNDCYTLIGPANTGYYMNYLAANTVAIQPPFCFGFDSAAKTLISVLG